MKVYVFVTLEGGLKEDINVTVDKNQAEGWEREWLGRYGFKNWEEYREEAGGMDHNYYLEIIEVEGGGSATEPLEVDEDKCPKCKGDLEHGVSEVSDGMELYYPVTCKRCEWSGRQIYLTRFDGYIDDEGVEVSEPWPLAKVRLDLIEKGQSVPVGNENYDGKEPLMYRWTDDDEGFQVFYKGKWVEAMSIDWVFD